MQENQKAKFEVGDTIERIDGTDYRLTVLDILFKEGGYAYELTFGRWLGCNKEKNWRKVDQPYRVEIIREAESFRLNAENYKEVQEIARTEKGKIRIERDGVELFFGNPGDIEAVKPKMEG